MSRDCDWPGGRFAATPSVLPNSRQGRAKRGVSILPAEKELHMQKVINCPCGFVVKAESDEQLVARAQQHAKDVHQMDLSREQALAMARPS